MIGLERSEVPVEHRLKWGDVAVGDVLAAQHDGGGLVRSSLEACLRHMPPLHKVLRAHSSAFWVANVVGEALDVSGVDLVHERWFLPDGGVGEGGGAARTRHASG